MNLPVTFAQASGKHVILSTTELLRMALITRLLLLLSALTRLLLTVTTWMPLKTGILTAARAMKATGP